SKPVREPNQTFSLFIWLNNGGIISRPQYATKPASFGRPLGTTGISRRRGPLRSPCGGGASA
ncbi:hypothetical protein EOD12_10215, partial [Mesorhizobium sp. M7A.T.Ca.TU.009.02.1.1]